MLCAAAPGCAPAEWAAVQQAGAVAGEAVDVLALGRAEQIRLKARAAEEAAARGDDLAAMRALNDALAGMAADEHRELMELRQRCAAPPSSTATPSPATPAVGEEAPR